MISVANGHPVAVLLSALIICRCEEQASRVDKLGHSFSYEKNMFIQTVHQIGQNAFSRFSIRFVCCIVS